MDQLYPQTGMNMVKVLEKLGCEVSYNPKQTCCGQPAFNAGYWDDCKPVAKKFLHDFVYFGFFPNFFHWGLIRDI
jgi:L-lactate dehydrogenase complex protein LldE